MHGTSIGKCHRNVLRGLYFEYKCRVTELKEQIHTSFQVDILLVRHIKQQNTRKTLEIDSQLCKSIFVLFENVLHELLVLR